MKVIKHGTKPKVLRGTCQRCGCVIECEPSEARQVEDRPGDGGHCVKCPDCGNDFLWVKP